MQSKYDQDLASATARYNAQEEDEQESKADRAIAASPAVAAAYQAFDTTAREYITGRAGADHRTRADLRKAAEDAYTQYGRVLDEWDREHPA